MTEQLFFHFRAYLQTLLEVFFPAFPLQSFCWSHLVGRAFRCAPTCFLCICPSVFHLENSVIAALPTSQGCVRIGIHKWTRALLEGCVPRTGTGRCVPCCVLTWEWRAWLRAWNLD